MDYLHITLEAEPYISWPKLRDAIALARRPDRSALTGADAVAGLIRRASSSDDEFPVRQALSEAHKDALTQALPDLPPLYTGMKPEEVEAFQEAHRNHPALRNFDVPYPYSRHDLEVDEDVWRKLKRHYEVIFNQALSEGRVTGINRDETGSLIHLEGKAITITPFTKLEKLSVTRLLLELGFLSENADRITPPHEFSPELGNSSSAAIPTQEATPASSEPETPQKSPTHQRTHERITLVTRAMDEAHPDKRDDPHAIYASLIRVIENAGQEVRCFRVADKDGFKKIINTGLIRNGVGKKVETDFLIEHLKQTLKTVRKQLDLLEVASKPLITPSTTPEPNISTAK